MSYASRTAAVTVSLDGTANDGESGENDNVGADVESITGGKGNDTLTGNDLANQLSGGRASTPSKEASAGMSCSATRARIPSPGAGAATCCSAERTRTP